MPKETYTHITLKLSPAAFDEIRGKLQAPGYENSNFFYNDDELIINMHGIAVKQEYEWWIISSYNILFVRGIYSGERRNC